VIPAWHRSLILLLLFLLLSTPACGGTTELRGRVLWIDDGDTIRVAEVGTVRLIGIDCPEREVSERDRHFLRLGIDPQKLRPIARAALAFNIREVKGKNVRLVLDAEPADRHGRTLAYVYLPDGTLLNRTLLEKGYGVVYRRFDFRMKNDFIAAEQEARSRGVGLWQK
jgi:micrococcal nuclease